MKKLSKKSLLLVAAVMALAALAMPSMASALTWGPVGTTHVLDSSNLSMSIPALGAGWTCSSTSLDIDVRNPASSTATITGASVSGCTGTGGATGCALDVTFTSFPWAITGIPGSVILDGNDIDITFTSGCPFAGTVISVTGSLTGGAWSGAAHSVTYASDTGLTATAAGSSLGGVTTSGTFTDTAGTLTLS